MFRLLMATAILALAAGTCQPPCQPPAAVEATTVAAAAVTAAAAAGCRPAGISRQDQHGRADQCSSKPNPFLTLERIRARAQFRGRNRDSLAQFFSDERRR